MIVLITGDTHTGKTALARRLMKRLYEGLAAIPGVSFSARTI